LKARYFPNGLQQKEFNREPKTSKLYGTNNNDVDNNTNSNGSNVEHEKQKDLLYYPTEVSEVEPLALILVKTNIFP
jgi:hypothetical protein